ncbi:hypothetical protein QBC44DRAFT_403933 [Cladorrhinum sp. PSN332]|nr:hypothetical protein QBC44DRAFT_403933 [Cladorrhinum sp. PSN332]
MSKYTITGTAPNGSTAAFTAYKQYFGVVDTSEGKPGDAVTVDISLQRPVALGKKLEIDFTQCPSGKVAVLHDSQGNLTIQKE